MQRSVVALLLATDCLNIWRHAAFEVDEGPRSTDREFWNKMAEDRSLIPLDYKNVLKTKEWEERHHLNIQSRVDRLSVTVWLNNHRIYEVIGKMWNGELSHGGIHELVLHPELGRIMFKRHFRTSQPGESSSLAKELIRVLPGRLILLIIVPLGGYFLDETAVRVIESLGSKKISCLAYNETWIMLTHKGGNSSKEDQSKMGTPFPDTSRALFETAVLTSLDRKGVSPLTTSTLVARQGLPVCVWHNHRSKTKQKHFCETYEGYPEICRCLSPLNPPRYRYSSNNLNTTENIPLAMLTAVNAHNFYRQLLNLLQLDGAAQTRVHVFIDGVNNEIIDIAAMFRLPVVVHRPQGSASSVTRLNMHFRFSVHSIFRLNPKASKAIILEDDLLLSPDFLSYFHQTAWLLDSDPTVYCINAFSVNSYATVASDPTALRRSGAFPQFGWMVTRHWATTQLPLWVQEQANRTDWDWWLGKGDIKRSKFTVVPEVSRTFHAGAAGAHVSGWEQAFFFDKMIYNQDKNVTLKSLRRLKQPWYDHFLEKEIEAATLLDEDFNPCLDRPLDGKKGKDFKITVMADSTNYDEHDGFLFMALCLRAHSRDFRDIYKGVQLYSLEGKLLYVIGCPLSPFCRLFKEGLRLLSPAADVLQLAEDRDFKWRSSDYNFPYKVRRQAQTPLEEYAMVNYLEVDRVLT